MGVWVIADQHRKPGLDFPDVREYSPLHVLGDAFEFIPYGPDEWKTEVGYGTRKNALVNTPDETLWYKGNHEGCMSWMADLLEKPFGMKIAKELWLDGEDGRKWLLTHGHRFSYWNIIDRFDDPIVRFLGKYSWTRKLWYDFCKRQGWIPSAYENPGIKYEPLVHSIHAAAIGYAGLKNTNIVIGHTHCSAEYVNQKFGNRVICLGAGELRYIEEI
jgi:hypothetical protein